MLVRFVYGPDGAETAETLKRVIAEEASAVEQFAQLSDLPARLRPGGQPSVTIVIRPEASPNIDDLVEFAQTHRAATYVVLVASDIPAVDYRRLINTGAGEWLPTPQAAAEITALVSRRASNPVQASADPSQAYFTAFLPAGGGVGASTLCAETAVYLATRMGGKDRRCCVVDLNLQQGNLCDLLDVEPQLDLAALAADPSRLDDQLLAAFRSRSAYGVDVFAPAKFSLDDHQAPAAAIFALCNALAQRYDFISADLPAYVFPWVEEIVRSSDLGVLTCTFSVPSALRAAALSRHLEAREAPTSHFVLAVNRMRTGWFGGGLNKAEFEAAVPEMERLYIPEDQALAFESGNLGKPMVIAGRRKPVVRGIAALAREIAVRREDKLHPPEALRARKKSAGAFWRRK